MKQRVKENRQYRTNMAKTKNEKKLINKEYLTNKHIKNKTLLKEQDRFV